MIARAQKTAPEPFSGPRYHDNASHAPAGTLPCAYCGKPVLLRRETLYAHVVEGGARFALPSESIEAGDFDEAGDQGCWPVGSECARRFPKRYLQLLPEIVESYRSASHDSMDPATCSCAECTEGR